LHGLWKELNSHRELLQGLLAGIENLRELVAELCGGDELAIQNLHNLLDPEE
jgi:hypothetical protein